MASKRLTRNISFSTYEKEIYDYLQEHENASRLIKHLVALHMMNNSEEISILQTMKSSNNIHKEEMAIAEEVIEEEVIEEEEEEVIKESNGEEVIDEDNLRLKEEMLKLNI